MKTLVLSLIQKQNDIQGQLLFLIFSKTVTWELGLNPAFGDLEAVCYQSSMHALTEKQHNMYQTPIKSQSDNNNQTAMSLN